MATFNRLFISFAVEDKTYRDLLVGQAKNKNSPFQLVDMSVKEPWDSAWKTKCRTKIKGCDGMIALVSKNTPKATGQLWEIACAKDEKVPVRGIHIDSDNKLTKIPNELVGVRIVGWTWPNIASFLNSL